VSPAPRSTCPEICVVVLNHNGGAMTIECLRTLLGTKWPADRLRVVLVDNASTDGIAERVEDELPGVRVLRSPINRGFAGGNNLALRALVDAEYVALINNDVTVGADWLAPLVETLEADPDVGAACPKILFAPAFVELTLRSPTRRQAGDRRELGVRVSGATVDADDVWADVQFVSGFWGPEHGRPPENRFQWTSGEAMLRIPSPKGANPPRCELRLAATIATAVETESQDECALLTVGAAPTWLQVSLGRQSVDVVNNAGSVLLEGRFGADRGFLQLDDDRFAHPTDVFAWCGAAVLLRRSYLEDVGLLDERLFLYYEDFELSWRGRSRGWRYRYEPRAVVRHVHSATTGENSRLADYYTTRNRLLILTRHATWSEIARALVREMLVTASYARRDIIVPLLYRRPVNRETVGRRLHAFIGYLRLAPSMIASRARDRLTRGASAEVAPQG
jgi:GT2 family glycosyltransferase